MAKKTKTQYMIDGMTKNQKRAFKCVVKGTGGLEAGDKAGTIWTGGSCPSSMARTLEGQGLLTLLLTTPHGMGFRLLVKPTAMGKRVGAAL